MEELSAFSPSDFHSLARCHLFPDVNEITERNLCKSKKLLACEGRTRMYLMLHEASPLLKESCTTLCRGFQFFGECSDLHIGESLRWRTSEWLIIKAEALQLSQAANFTVRRFFNFWVDVHLIESHKAFAGNKSLNWSLPSSARPEQHPKFATNLRKP